MHRRMALVAPLVFVSLSATGLAVTTKGAAPRSAAEPAPARACRDARTTSTERVNVGGVDAQTKKPVLRAALSANGRFVAFSSAASALVPADRDRSSDVFVRDLLRHRTTRVSVSSTGAEGNGASFFPSISAEGRFVAFPSFASNLVRHDRNRAEDVFVHDRSDQRLHRRHGGVRATVPAYRFRTQVHVTRVPERHRPLAAFGSHAASLVEGDTNHVEDVFVRDLERGRTIRVSVGPRGRQSNGGSRVMGISGDGSVALFVSSADNLVRGDTNGSLDAFVRVRATCPSP